MADLKRRLMQVSGADPVERLRDMGDGTHAVVVSAVVRDGASVEIDADTVGTAIDAAIRDGGALPVSLPADPLSVELAASGLPLVTAGTTAKINSTITRPADTAQYAAGEAVTNSTSAPATAIIANAARAIAGTGIILNATLIDNEAPATAGEFEAWIFDTTITPDNDNAAFTPTDAELLTLVAIVPFGSGDSFVGTASGNRVYQSAAINRGFVCAAVSASLYWALVVRNAYTPVSAETFTLRLTILQD